MPKFTPTEGLFRFLFISTAWFTGAFERDDFGLTVVFPSVDGKGGGGRTLDGPYVRSTFMLSFEVNPPEKKLGIWIPMYEFVGEEVSALLGAYYGKLILNGGHMQAGDRLTVPSMWTDSCRSYAKPPFNHQPRKPDGPPLELPAAEKLLRAYFQDNDEDLHLASILRSGEFYRMALENYDERPEMSFALLISALESLTNLVEYTEEDIYDEGLRKDFSLIEAQGEQGQKIVARLKGRLYQVRRKIAKLVDTFVPDSFFIQREASATFGLVKDRIELRARILAAYDIRSRLLHTGNRRGIWFLQMDQQGMEYGPGKPVMKDSDLVELLCKSLNLVGLERVTSTVLRSAIDRWLQQSPADVPAAS